MFGRKKGSPGGGDSASRLEQQKNEPGHQAVLRHLREKEVEEPGIRERLAGAILFDFVYELMKDERGVRIENLLAALASVGGQECIASLVETAPPNTTMEQLGLTIVKGNDGRLYFFGDAPNRLLVESPDSLLSLAFGAAQALGAAVTMEMITDEMRKVASTIGGPEFETLDLPPEHMVDRPTEWARVFRPKLAEPMDLYDVPKQRRATTVGYTLQKAIDAAQQAIDPLLAARIVLVCATRTAKVLIN